MARRRMYVFERAYVDFARRLGDWRRDLVERCKSVWRWFWQDSVRSTLEIMLRVGVILVALLLGFLYVHYENEHNRSVSPGTIGAFVIIAIFATLVLWGWKAPMKFLALVFSSAMASGSIFLLALVAIVVMSVAFSFYLIALVILTSLSFVVFLPMRLLHGAWTLYNRIFHQCPYDNCDHRGLPIHVCKCGEWYYDLRPSFYGIFHHVCRHDNGEVRLPTLDFWGRNRMERLCAECKRPLKDPDLGIKEVIPVAIIGAQSAGKTIFLRQVAGQLGRHLGLVEGSSVHVKLEEQRAELDRDLQLLGRGQTLPKTAGTVFRALGLSVHVPKRLDCLLHLFDAPGEHFTSMEFFGSKQVMAHVRGIILLVDPFASPGFAEEAQRMAGGLQPARDPLIEVVGTLIRVVDQVLLRRSTDGCQVRLAVVLSKADAHPDLRQLCPQRNRPLTPETSARCRGILEQLGEGGSVRALEQKFASIRYFACSPLGRMPDARDARPFHPVGVTEPLLWLLGLKK